jgi:hypothetical protein
LGQPARERRLAAAQRDRAHLHDHPVEQPRVVELAGEVAAADDPRVLPLE